MNLVDFYYKNHFLLALVHFVLLSPFLITTSPALINSQYITTLLQQNLQKYTGHSHLLVTFLNDMLQVVYINNKKCGTGNKELLGQTQEIVLQLSDNYRFSSIINKWIMAVRTFNVLYGTLVYKLYEITNRCSYMQSILFHC